MTARSNEVRLTFLGSGDAFGSGGRFQTCLHLGGPGGELLIDCGASSLIAMKRAGIDPSGIGWVVLTHLHGDHFGGLPFMMLDGQFSGRTRPLVIAGPPGTRTRVKAAMEVLFPGSSQTHRRFETEFLEITEGATTPVGPVLVTPVSVRHESGDPSYAVRIEYQGKVVAYSGDTEWTERLPEIARGADLLVCEAYSFERRIRYHLDYRTLSSQRARLRCQRIILTHMSQDMLARLEEVDFECARDGQVIVLGGASTESR